MTERTVLSKEDRPPLAVALIIFAALAGVEWVWGRWAAPLFPSGVDGVLLVTFTARLLDVLLLAAITRTSFLTWKQMGLRRKSWKDGVRVGITWSLFLGGIVTLGLTVFRLASGRLPSLFPAGSVWFKVPWPGLGYVLVAVVLSPFVEELVFRGLLYQAVRSRCTIPTSVILTTAPFAVAHGISADRVAPAVIGGILCALSFERSRSLWTPVILHISGNGFLWIYGFWSG